MNSSTAFAAENVGSHYRANTILFVFATSLLIYIYKIYQWRKAFHSLVYKPILPQHAIY